MPGLPQQMPLEAAGDIRPSRFIKMTGPNRALEGTENCFPVGITLPGTQGNGASGSTTYCVTTGNPVPYAGPGNADVPLYLEGPVNGGDLIESGPNGGGVALGSSGIAGAQAQDSGVAGDTIRVYVLQFGMSPAAASSST